MKRYTKEELLEAVREELTEANQAFNISEKLTDDDYEFLGVVAAACERIDFKRREQKQTINT